MIAAAKIILTPIGLRCGPTFKCRHGGTCTNNNDGVGICACTEGFSGPRCEHDCRDANDCAANLVTKEDINFLCQRPYGKRCRTTCKFHLPPTHECFTKSGCTPADGASQGNCAKSQICYPAGCSDQCSKDASGGTAGDGDGTPGNCGSGKFCYNGMACSAECSKEIRPTRLPGDGTTKGNCQKSQEICYATGCSNQCSKDDKDGVAGDGTGKTKGNCAEFQVCSANGKCSKLAMKPRVIYGK